MKKWIDVAGKKMDSVEFARFIREQAAPETEDFVKAVVQKEHSNNIKLKRLQEAA